MDFLEGFLGFVKEKSRFFEWEKLEKFAMDFARIGFCDDFIGFSRYSSRSFFWVL